MSAVHVLFENEDWMPPLREALKSRGLPVQEHFITDGSVDPNDAPAEGVWINRMSPSAHTRDHQGGVVLTRLWLEHLEAHRRPVLNGTRAFGLEVSKVRQDQALRRAGILTPHTVAVVGGADALVSAAQTFPQPFITKHNQGGKGLGVQLFRSIDAFEAHVGSPEFLPSPDGVTLLQQYIEPAEPFITRIEIVDGQFLYAIKSSTVGGFELCPADACAVDDNAFCPADGSDTFSLRTDITAEDPLVKRYIAMMAAEGLDIAGIEFVEDAEGRRWTYDINGTTNFNGTVEAQHGVYGMQAIAALAERRLAS
ncbi:MAG: RimK family alpha-L-glutamate ligase [Myxococcota bacterium]